jgi:hypothetical protein
VTVFVFSLLRPSYSLRCPWQRITFIAIQLGVQCKSYTVSDRLKKRMSREHCVSNGGLFPRMSPIACFIQDADTQGQNLAGALVRTENVTRNIKVIYMCGSLTGKEVRVPVETYNSVSRNSRGGRIGVFLHRCQRSIVYYEGSLICFILYHLKQSNRRTMEVQNEYGRKWGLWWYWRNNTYRC